MSADEIAGAFAQHYYGTLDSNIAGLGALYVRRGEGREGGKEGRLPASGVGCVARCMRVDWVVGTFVWAGSGLRLLFGSLV